MKVVITAKEDKGILARGLALLLCYEADDLSDKEKLRLFKMFNDLTKDVK